MPTLGFTPRRVETPSRKKVTEPEPRVGYSAESPKGGRDLGISPPRKRLYDRQSGGHRRRDGVFFGRSMGWDCSRDLATTGMGEDGAVLEEDII